MSLSLSPEKRHTQTKGEDCVFSEGLSLVFEVFSTCLANNEDVTTSEGGRKPQRSFIHFSSRNYTREREKKTGWSSSKKEMTFSVFDHGGLSWKKNFLTLINSAEISGEREKCQM